MLTGRYGLPAAAGKSYHAETGERPCNGRTRGRATTAPFQDGKTDVLGAEREQMIKSLQDRQDETMEHYSAYGGTSEKVGHFARICRTNRQPHAWEQPQPCIKNSSDIESGAPRKVEHHRHSLRQSIMPSAHMDPRDHLEWQESFDVKVKKLFIDFELTNSPNSRMNHHERMHDWFAVHGQKEIRKSKGGPSFLTADRTRSMPPGSTANIPRLDLAGNHGDHAFSAPFFSPGLSSRSSSRRG